MSDVFSDTPSDPSNPFEQLVGEGKKFKTPEDLAAGKIEADRTIEARNRELEESRQEQERLRLRILELERPREPAADTIPREANRPVEEEPVDLATRIREELNRQTQEDIRNQNLSQVVNRLEEVYGDRANEFMKTKAGELGVPVTWLRDIAAQSPKAFYAQIGLADQVPTTPAATRGDINPVALADTRNSTAVKEGTYKYYETVRKSDPKRYFSAEVQNKMFADAKRLGEAFYN